MKTDRTIETLRGLACLLLVFYHVVGSNPASGLRIDDGALRVLNDGLAYLRMPLFACLSGLVYGLRPFDGDSRGFVLGKARRLLVPMIVVGTAFALAQSNVPHTNFAARNWSLLHVEPVAHFWFVESLFWVFMATLVLERARVLRTPREFAGVWLLAAALYLTIRGPRWLGIEGAIYLLPYFLGGLAVSRFSLRARLGGRRARALLAGAAVLAIASLGVPESDPDRRTFWILVAGVALCALVLGLRVDAGWLARVGVSSYPIFLFHVFFTAASRIGLDAVGVANLPVHVAAGVGLGVVGPMAVEHWAARRDWWRVVLLGKGRRTMRGAMVRPEPLQ
jgi:peptidoglycan/LPS O-acetylase OafA/YrhL